MTEDEWLDDLRHLPDETIIQLHFGLQEKIKKHYKLRESGSNLQKAIALCEQQIALSPLTLEAMKRKHQEEVNEYRRVTGKTHPAPDFYYPSHYGYKQLFAILKKQKNLEKLAEMKVKHDKEGWK
ncbi:TPA: hypothetical protein ACWDIM_004520 [Yersinia enterocolitica]|nr:hypothetical protein [Yersinia enterocolitica]